MPRRSTKKTEQAPPVEQPVVVAPVEEVTPVVKLKRAITTYNKHIADGFAKAKAEGRKTTLLEIAATWQKGGSKVNAEN